jgi:hypothetical protein
MLSKIFPVTNHQAVWVRSTGVGQGVAMDSRMFHPMHETSTPCRRTTPETAFYPTPYAYGKIRIALHDKFEENLQHFSTKEEDRCKTVWFKYFFKLPVKK